MKELTFVTLERNVLGRIKIRVKFRLLDLPPVNLASSTLLDCIHYLPILDSFSGIFSPPSYFSEDGRSELDRHSPWKGRTIVIFFVKFFAPFSFLGMSLFSLCLGNFMVHFDSVFGLCYRKLTLILRTCLGCGPRLHTPHRCFRNFRPRSAISPFTGGYSKSRLFSNSDLWTECPNFTYFHCDVSVLCPWTK